MNDTAPDKPTMKPEMKPAPPAQAGQEAVEASDSGRPWILGMAGAVMLVIGLIVGSTLWGAPKMTAHVEPFLQIASNGEYPRAYSQIGQEWRAVTPQQEFEALHRNLFEVMGAYQSLRQTHLEEFESPHLGQMAKVEFDGQFEKGTVQVTALLRKTADGWSIVGMGYDSPLLEAAWKQRQTQPGAPAPTQTTPPPTTQPTRP